MADRTMRRNFDSKSTEAIINVLNILNQFCFHDSGADDDCGGCCFEGCAPCPLAVFHDKLAEKLYKR